jgi:hypothetical protein
MNTTAGIRGWQTPASAQRRGHDERYAARVVSRSHSARPAALIGRPRK